MYKGIVFVILQGGDDSLDYPLSVSNIPTLNEVYNYIATEMKAYVPITISKIQDITFTNDKLYIIYNPNDYTNKVLSNYDITVNMYVYGIHPVYDRYVDYLEINKQIKRLFNK